MAQKFEVVNERTDDVREFSDVNIAIEYAYSELNDGYAIYEVIPDGSDDRLIERCPICNSTDERFLEGMGRR